MSLLTDKDFLLHTLHLSFLRRVLPSHAPASASSGHSNPYNLVTFPPPEELAARSPYLSLSGLADESAHPELASGRNSPPLALQLARAPVEEGGRRRRGGPGQLGYTQTITGKGSGVVSGGMRVQAGKPRTWKGKEKLSAAGEEPEKLDKPAEGDEKVQDGFGRRRSHPDFLSSQLSPTGQLQPPTSATSANNALSLQPHPLPPNVIIHSPVRTPHDSPAISPHPLRAPRNGAFAEMQQRQRQQPAEPSGEDLSGSPSSPVSPAAAAVQRRRRFAEPAEPEQDPDHPGSPASPSDFPSRPLSRSVAQSQGTLASSLLGGVDDSAPASPSASQAIASSVASSSSGPAPSPSPSPLATPTLDDSDADAFSPAPGFAGVGAGGSVASSGVSLFGTSRLAGSNLARDRSDSEASSLAGPPSPTPAEPPEAAPVAPEVPVFKLPPGLRVRERRRVNLRPGRMLVPPPAEALGPVEEHHGEGREAHEEVARPATPAPATAGTETQERRRAQSSPQRLTFAEEPATASAQTRPVGTAAGASAPPSPERERERKVSAPPAMLAPPSRTASPSSSRAPSPSSSRPPSPSPSPSPPHPAAAPASLAPPTSPTPRRPPSPGLFFPPRGLYIRQAQSSARRRAQSPPEQPKSALSALLAAPSVSGGASGGSSNPFNRLYGALISRASDALQLTLYFPSSSKPSKPLKVGVKRDVTVEEVLGVGLWCYVDEEREPGVEQLDEPGWEERAREGEETTRWELRICEDEGEVDEDFPALDRTRAISAFSFNEFAIVRATGQQIADNAAKQSTLARRPSRILASAPTPSAATPAPAPPTEGAAPSLTPAPSAQEQEVTLKVRLPPALVELRAEKGDNGGATMEVKVNGGMLLEEVLELLLSLLPPVRAFPGVPAAPLPASDFALLLPLSDAELVLPLDRTVEGLSGERRLGAMGQKELLLVPKREVGGVGMGLGVGGKGRREEDPFSLPVSPAIPAAGASAAHQPAPYQSTSTQLTAQTAPYVHYNVLRKLPMSLGGRHARTIALDGDYLHFMPPSSRQNGGGGGANDPAASSGRTTSFHISAVHSCKISRRSANSFKIVVHTSKGIGKRYDFEAASQAEAREIVERVREVMRVYGEEARAEGRRVRRYT
ncbi:hypothetical protein JCM10213_000199 [Rhodosporidiobolus nylandii]